MGSIKRQKKKYSRPGHPWQKARIEEERALVNEYGLVNKKEVWKFNSKLQKFKDQAKKLIVSTAKQAEVEKAQLLNRLKRLGVIDNSINQLDTILALSIKDLLARRLQTVVLRLGLARSVKQARQFIVHGHIFVNGRKMTAPSYMVPVAQQASIEFCPRSTLSDAEHPERVVLKPKVEEKPEAEESEKGSKKGAKEDKKTSKEDKKEKKEKKASPKKVGKEEAKK